MDLKHVHEITLYLFFSFYDKGVMDLFLFVSHHDISHTYFHRFSFSFFESSNGSYGKRILNIETRQEREREGEYCTKGKLLN